jgi:hypothetical protein
MLLNFTSRFRKYFLWTDIYFLGFDLIIHCSSSSSGLQNLYLCYFHRERCVILLYFTIYNMGNNKTMLLGYICMPWAAFGLFRYGAAVYVLYSPVFVSSCDFLTLYVIYTRYTLHFLCLFYFSFFNIFINSPFHII